MSGKAERASIGERVKIPLEGNLGLRDAKRVCAVLREAIAGCDPVEIDIGGLTGLDVSIAQLLLAARNSAQRQSQALFISGTWAPACRDALIMAGLLHPAGTAETPDADFWLGQTPSKLQAPL